MTGRVLIPELCVRDVDAAAAMLVHVFGFAPEGTPNRLRLGAQLVQLRSVERPPGHGVIDHVAIAVADVTEALAAAKARGGVLDAQVTPDGPLFIQEFWGQGTHYVFLEGPEGSRIELCARPGPGQRPVPGHDHTGIACRDLPAMCTFLKSLGLVDVAETTLIRPDGDVPVCFLSLPNPAGGALVELYSPPDLRAGRSVQSAEPFWRRLILLGAETTDDLAGPEGIVVSRLAR